MKLVSGGVWIFFLFGAVSAAEAGVVVSASGNSAIANVSLSSGGRAYTAEITITFSGAQNLNPTELNLSAQLVDPSDPGLLARLPACPVPSLGCVTIDPNFPLRYLVYVLIIVSVGGMGTISGTLIAGLALGIADVAGKYYFPDFGGFGIYAITILVMLWRPRGLLGRHV